MLSRRRRVDSKQVSQCTCYIYLNLICIKLFFRKPVCFKLKMLEIPMRYPRRRGNKKNFTEQREQDNKITDTIPKTKNK